MIIDLRQFGPGDFRAALRGDTVGVIGFGDSAELAVGNLIYAWAGAQDSKSASEAVDVRISAHNALASH